MPLFRKKPVAVEAVQFTEAMALGDEPLPVGVRCAGRSVGGPPGWEVRTLLSHDHFIETLEGRMRVKIGDWIITGVRGERYPCKSDIFEVTYEPVGDETTSPSTTSSK